jgi:hypothetical protein
LQNEEIKYYPNPASNMFTFYTSGDGGIINWMDISGKIVFTSNIIRGMNRIALNRFSQGIYVMQYFSKSGLIYSKRIEIMRP